MERIAHAQEMRGTPNAGQDWVKANRKRAAKRIGIALAITAAAHFSGVTDKMADGIQAVNHYLSSPSV